MGLYDNLLKLTSLNVLSINDYWEFCWVTMFLSSHLSWSLEIVWRISFCACLSRVWVVFFILTARLDKRWRFNEMGMRMRMRYWRLRELSISMDRLLGCRKIQQPITYKQCPKVRVPSMRPFIQLVRQPTSPLALRLR